MVAHKTEANARGAYDLEIDMQAAEETPLGSWKQIGEVEGHSLPHEFCRII